MLSIAGTDDGEDDLEQGSIIREVQQDGQNAGRKLSAKTIKAILELICDEAVSRILNLPTLQWREMGFLQVCLCQ